MAVSSSALERDAWRLFDVDFRVEDGGLGAYLDQILARCMDWFDATSASIFLRDGATDNFRFAAGEPDLKGTSLHVGSGIAGVVAETGQAVLVNDPSNHPLLKGRVKGNRQSQLSSSIVVPITEGSGHCIGVVNLARKHGKSNFANNDLHRVQSLARQISLAVVNARLFAEVTGAVSESERANEKLHAVLKSLGVAILVLDTTGQITDWNHEAGVLFDLNLDHWPWLVTDLNPQEIAVNLKQSLTHVTKKGPNHRRAESADGRSWSITVTALDGGGATATIVDTTEHDRSLVEMDRLKRLAEVGQMTAAIAHEIRNPLTGIRTAAQLVATAPDQAEELAAIIDEEVLKLNKLCEDFLEFARPLSLRLRPMSLAEVCGNVADRHRDDFVARNVELIVEIEPNPPTIQADALRIEQVARNLLLNALQASQAGGKVQMKVGDRWLSVEDSGCGMTPEDQDRLFTPFFTTKASGTGLGLSNLRKIIDAHGGKITVTSEVGRGSTFAVALPSEVAA